jgi:hypothetical protein
LTQAVALGRVFTLGMSRGATPAIMLIFRMAYAGSPSGDENRLYISASAGSESWEAAISSL